MTSKRRDEDWQCAYIRVKKHIFTDGSRGRKEELSKGTNT